MQYLLTQRFFFEAAHTLNRNIDTAPSKRVHGHTYYCELTLAGLPNAQTGMVVDLGHVRRAITPLRDRLDHHLLNEIDTLGVPTLENLCTFIANALRAELPALHSVRVWREAMGDGCTLLL
jgi:6-pyruvoyltetrahydropterin/6-carboxytetrahydropterin synthase